MREEPKNEMDLRRHYVSLNCRDMYWGYSSVANDSIKGMR
jgi:hypothetical protein